MSVSSNTFAWEIIRDLGTRCTRFALECLGMRMGQFVIFIRARFAHPCMISIWSFFFPRISRTPFLVALYQAQTILLTACSRRRLMGGEMIMYMKEYLSTIRCYNS